MVRVHQGSRDASIALTWLALLTAPAALFGEICDLSGTESDGGAQAFVQYEVDVDASTLTYGIAVNGLGTITDAEIFRGADLFLDLNPVGVAGSASATVTQNGLDFSDFVNNPQNYSTTISGTATSIKVVVERAGDCLNENGLPPVDLAVVRLSAKNKLKATVKNLSTADSEESVVQFFQSVDDTFDEGQDLFFAEARLKSVKANKRRKAKTANRGGEAGEFFVIACADPQGFNNDPDFDNNCTATKNAVEFD